MLCCFTFTVILLHWYCNLKHGLLYLCYGQLYCGVKLWFIILLQSNIIDNNEKQINTHKQTHTHARTLSHVQISLRGLAIKVMMQYSVCPPTPTLPLNPTLNPFKNASFCVTYEALSSWVPKKVDKISGIAILVGTFGPHNVRNTRCTHTFLSMVILLSQSHTHTYFCANRLLETSKIGHERMNGLRCSRRTAFVQGNLEL